MPEKKRSGNGQKVSQLGQKKIGRRPIRRAGFEQQSPALVGEFRAPSARLASSVERRICNEPLGLNVGSQGQPQLQNGSRVGFRILRPQQVRASSTALSHLETQGFLPPHRGKEGCEHFASSLGHLTQLRELSLDLYANNIGPGTRSAFRAGGGVG